MGALSDHFVKQIDGEQITLFNVHHEAAEMALPADRIVMATGHRSESALLPLPESRGVSAEMIGDAVAPRYTYEAVYEGHRHACKL